MAEVGALAGVAVEDSNRVGCSNYGNLAYNEGEHSASSDISTTQDAVLRSILDSGGMLVDHADVNNTVWAELPELTLHCALPCHCFFIVGRTCELGPRGSVLLMAPVTEEVDLATVGPGLGIHKRIQLGSTEFCRNTFHCEPELLTPLAACTCGANTRVAISTACSVNEGQQIGIHVTRSTTLICLLKNMIEVLCSKGARIIQEVPCTPASALAIATTSTDTANVSGPPAMVVAALEGYSGMIHWVTDTHSASLDEFRDLKTKTGIKYPCSTFDELCDPTNNATKDGVIVAESTETIRMLLASDFFVEKLLLKPSLFAGLRSNIEARAQHRKEAPVMVFLCEAALMEEISGVPAKHATAALAVARRQPPLATLTEALPQLSDLDAPIRMLALQGLDEEGIGALLRVAAGFDVNAVLLSDDCADQFHRKTVRVSMGHVFRVRMLRGDLQKMFSELRAKSVFTIAATTTSKVEGVRCLDELKSMPLRWICTIGPGGPVASPELRAICDLSIRVRTAVPDFPLGVAVMTSILLHGCVEREDWPEDEEGSNTQAPLGGRTGCE